MKLAKVLLCSAFLYAGIASAQGTPDTSAMMNKASDMAKAELNEIRTAMKDCMMTDKTGKTCGEKAMTKCQEKMGADECTKLVSQVKKELKIK